MGLRHSRRVSNCERNSGEGRVDGGHWRYRRGWNVVRELRLLRHAGKCAVGFRYQVMRICLKLLFLVSLTPLVVFSAPAKTLDFYTIDVEGGKSVLVVSPTGESMLLDAGWPAAGNRAASTERIVAALKGAGLKQLDYLVISHFDIDHIGDVPALAARFPIRHIMDHGQPRRPPSGSDRERFNAYEEVRQKIGRTVLTPGDKVPLTGVDIEVVTSAGRLLSQASEGRRSAKPSVCHERAGGAHRARRGGRPIHRAIVPVRRIQIGRASCRERV